MTLDIRTLTADVERCATAYAALDPGTTPPRARLQTAARAWAQALCGGLLVTHEPTPANEPTVAIEINAHLDRPVLRRAVYTGRSGAPEPATLTLTRSGPNGLPIEPDAGEKIEPEHRERLLTALKRIAAAAAAHRLNETAPYGRTPRPADDWWSAAFHLESAVRTIERWLEQGTAGGKTDLAGLCRELAWYEAGLTITFAPEPGDCSDQDAAGPQDRQEECTLPTTHVLLDMRSVLSDSNGKLNATHGMRSRVTTLTSNREPLLLQAAVSRAPDNGGTELRYACDDLERTAALINEYRRRRGDGGTPRAPLADRLAAALGALARHPAVDALQE